MSSPILPVSSRPCSFWKAFTAFSVSASVVTIGTVIGERIGLPRQQHLLVAGHSLAL